jgi:hypothetical protein
MIDDRRVQPKDRFQRIVWFLEAAGIVAILASACSILGTNPSDAAGTRSAQTLVALITQMAAAAPSPTPTSYALPETAPTATIGPTATKEPTADTSGIPTVRLSSPSPHLQRATYRGSTPTTDATSLLTSTITGQCNAAFFVGSAPPIYDGTEVAAGSTFVKIWVIRNVGTCTWYPSYMLYWHSGARMEAPGYIDFPQITPPNKNLFLSVTLKAPDEPGNYYQRWYIRDPEYIQFGIGPNYTDPLMVRVKVV